MSKSAAQLNVYITRLLSKFAEQRTCDWYDGEYLLTLKQVITYITDTLTTPPYKYDTATVIAHIRQRITMGYHQHIAAIERKLRAVPQLEQRSAEWFRFRESIITGSEAGYFVGSCGFSSAMNAFRGKINLSCSRPHNDNPAIKHGTNYECVAKKIYESRYRVRVMELGCLVSPSPCVGASPDGIVFETTASDFDSLCRYGRMVEIKCPYTRVIDDTIKPEYKIQIYQQQYTCQLPICDFVECGLIDSEHGGVGGGVLPYEDMGAMLGDRYDEYNYKRRNVNIPVENLTRDGYEKGIMIVAFDNPAKPTAEQFVYPLDKVYKVDEIDKWISMIESMITTMGYKKYSVKYWKVYKYSIKTKIFNQMEYEEDTLKILHEIWENVKIFRDMSEDDREIHVKNIKTFEELRIRYDITMNPVHDMDDMAAPISVGKPAKMPSKAMIAKDKKAAEKANAEKIEELLRNIKI